MFSSTLLFRTSWCHWNTVYQAPSCRKARIKILFNIFFFITLACPVPKRTVKTYCTKHEKPPTPTLQKPLRALPSRAAYNECGGRRKWHSIKFKQVNFMAKDYYTRQNSSLHIWGNKNIPSLEDRCLNWVLIHSSTSTKGSFTYGLNNQNAETVFCFVSLLKHSKSFFLLGMCS